MDEVSVPRWVRQWNRQYLGRAAGGVKGSQAGMGVVQLQELIWDHLVIKLE